MMKFLRILVADLDKPTITEPPPEVLPPTHSTHRSIETLLVVLAVITIVGVVAGVLARVCGGRHLAGSGEHDIEGWVERRCRNCIDGGLPPPPVVAEAKAAEPQAEEAAKK